MGATEFGHYDGGMVGRVARRLIYPGAFEGRGEGRARSATGPLSEPPGVETQGSGGAEAPGGEVARRRFECLRGKAGG
jgi:hypothetical protein